MAMGRPATQVYKLSGGDHVHMLPFPKSKQCTFVWTTRDDQDNATQTARSYVVATDIARDMIAVLDGTASEEQLGRVKAHYVSLRMRGHVRAAELVAKLMDGRLHREMRGQINDEKE